MNERIEQALEAPFFVRVGIFLASVGLIVGAYWFLFYSPLGEEIASMDTELEGLNVEIQEKQRIVANLTAFEAEVARLGVELKKALAELPDKKEVAQLLERIADRARDSGLDVQLFKPQAEQRKDYYAEVPIEIEVGGSYHQVASFFDEVAHLERIVNIDTVNMTNPEQTEAGLRVKAGLVATSFRFLDPSERPKEDKEAKKRRPGAKKESAE